MRFFQLPGPKQGREQGKAGAPSKEIPEQGMKEAFGKKTPSGCQRATELLHSFPGSGITKFPGRNGAGSPSEPGVVPGAPQKRMGRVGELSPERPKWVETAQNHGQEQRNFPIIMGKKPKLLVTYKVTVLE